MTNTENKTLSVAMAIAHSCHMDPLALERLTAHYYLGSINEDFLQGQNMYNQVRSQDMASTTLPPDSIGTLLYVYEKLLELTALTGSAAVHRLITQTLLQSDVQTWQ